MQLPNAAAFAASLHTRDGAPLNLQILFPSTTAFAALLHTRDGGPLNLQILFPSATAFAASLHTRDGGPLNLQMSLPSAAAFAASLHTREGVVATCCRVCHLIAYAGNAWRTLHIVLYWPPSLSSRLIPTICTLCYAIARR